MCSSDLEFQRVYSKGAKKVSRFFVVFMLPNALEHSRFGLTTPRKLGPAVQRNRIRRRLREIFRLAWASVPTGVDIVVNPRKPSTEAEFQDLRSELLPLVGAQPQ